MTNDDGRFPEGRLHTRDGTLSRRGLLRACAAALCLTGLPALLAGCAKPKAGRGDGDGPTTHEPQALGGSRAVGEKVEVRVGGGATVGVLDAAEGATGAVLMVGGMAGGSRAHPGSTPSSPDGSGSPPSRPCASTTASSATLSRVPKTYSRPWAPLAAVAPRRR